MAAVLVLGLVAFAAYEIRGARRIVLDTMQRGAASTVEAVARGVENALRANAEIEALVAERLLGNARLVRDLDARSGLTDTMLARISHENALFRINVFDAAGRRVATNHRGGAGRRHGGAAPSGEIDAILRGEATELVIGLREARHEPGDRYAAAVRRSGGGAIVVNIDAAEMLSLRRSAGEGRLVQEIGENPGVVYVVLQDQQGIVLASREVAEMPKIGTDPFLVAALGGHEARFRMTDFEGQRVFEAAMPFAVAPGDDGLLRIGLAAGVLEAEEARVKRRMGLLAILLALLGATVVGLVAIRRSYVRLDTERAALESDLKRQERLAAMGELASGVAHEVRNPLNAIGMIAQRLEREFEPTADGDDYRGHLRTVRDEIHRVNGIVRQFLELARPPKLSPRAVALAGLLEDATQVMDARASTKGLRIVRHFQDVGDLWLDPDQIKQVVLNLLENAVDATAAGEIRISCQVQEDGWVELVVADTGEGIAEGDLEKIFDLYFTTKPEGTGLGLSMVYKIVSEHGGRIDVESQVGAGTRFRIRLPGGTENEQ